MMVPTMGKNSYKGQVRSKELIIRRNNGEKYRNSKEWVGWSGVVWSGVGWDGVGGHNGGVYQCSTIIVNYIHLYDSDDAFFGKNSKI